MKRIPRLAVVMTPFPYSVDVAMSAAQALELMQAHGFQHLPVTRDFKPLSLVSAHDIANATTLGGRSPADVKIGDICQKEPYLVDLNTPIDVVVEQLAERQIPVAVVTRGEKTAGIFTSVDACRLLAQILRGEEPIPDSVA